MRRRDLFPLVAAAPAILRGARDGRPNIVIILADDMGFSDLGCFGSEIATPNLDGLARRGAVFTQFYNASVCAPTRASLMTGLYPHRAGVGHNRPIAGKPSYQARIAADCPTIAERLRGAGYQTWMSGKWHLGAQRPHLPVDRGFQRFFGLLSGAANYFRHDPRRPMGLDDKPFRISGKFYMTDAITDYALTFLRDGAANPKPFFLYLAYTAPHDPLHAPPEDIARYRGKYRQGWEALRRERYERMLKLGVLARPWPLSPRDPASPPWETVKDKDYQDLAMSVYAAMIDRMDQNIGRLLAALRAAGRDRNTLILFLSDNGGCSEFVNEGKPGALPGDPDSNLSTGLPWANVSNTPFRGFKQQVYEGGISTPLIAVWPERRRGPRFEHQPGHLIDLMPTCLDAASVAGVKCEGLSLLPALDGGWRPGPRTLCWEHEGARAVRQGDWKLVAGDGRPWELYDMRASRTELNDLAARDPDAVARMSRAYNEWAAGNGVLPWRQLLEEDRQWRRSKAR